MENRNLADEARDPLSIERCRGLLADEADDLSDDDLDRVRRHADALAHVIVDIFLAQTTAQE